MCPTPYGELNVLLAELTGRARQILGARFVAAYLQGSFAVTTACRILYTLETAQVASKRASLRWAMDHLALVAAAPAAGARGPRTRLGSRSSPSAGLRRADPRLRGPGTGAPHHAGIACSP